MVRRIAIVGALVCGAVFVVSTSMAADNEPKKANKYQATLVNAYDECTAPSEVTGGTLPLPACPAVDPSGATCNFGEKGSGKAQAKAKDDVSLKLLAKGLENCDGTTLQATATIQVTTNNCTVSSRCTTVTLENFQIPGATCLVDKGKCLIKGTVNGFAPGTLTPNENTNISLGSVGLQSGTTTVVTAGVLVL
jgi:hypothetical protein